MLAAAKAAARGDDSSDDGLSASKVRDLQRSAMAMRKVAAYRGRTDSDDDDR